MPAARASMSTVSQPVATTGENAITSTFCAMKLRSALIWFSCFCWASAKRRSMLLVMAADLIDSVFAVRHSLSAPIWLKPSTMRSSIFLARAARGRERAGGNREHGESSDELHR